MCQIYGGPLILPAKDFFYLVQVLRITSDVNPCPQGRLKDHFEVLVLVLILVVWLLPLSLPLVLTKAFFIQGFFNDLQQTMS